MSWKELIDISGALLTPLIAIIATYIAWQQWKTNHQKLILEKYDRRLKVYGHVVKVIALVQRDADIKMEDLIAFKGAVAEADFLFGNEVTDYIDTVFKRANKLRTCNVLYSANLQQSREGYNHEKNTDEMDSEIRWFSEQYDAAKTIFKKYIDISK